MEEYRRDVVHAQDSEYHWVELGPIPGLPEWHIQSGLTKYPFPKEGAAFRFAENARATYPGREVEVVTVDGERFVL